MNTIQEITKEFAQIVGELRDVYELSSESATQVATVILQESGKFQRTQILQGSNQNNNRNNQPATEKQKYTLKKHGVTFSDDITKAEASALLDKVMPK